MRYRELAINLQMHPIDDYKTLIRRLLEARLLECSYRTTRTQKPTVFSLQLQNPCFSRNKVNFKREKGTSFRNRSNKPKHDKRADKDIKCFQCEGKGYIASECKFSWKKIQRKTTIQEGQISDITTSYTDYRQ